MHRKNIIFLKTISLIVALCFSFSQITFANPEIFNPASVIDTLSPAVGLPREMGVSAVVEYIGKCLLKNRDDFNLLTAQLQGVQSGVRMGSVAPLDKLEQAISEGKTEVYIQGRASENDIIVVPVESKGEIVAFYLIARKDKVKPEDLMGERVEISDEYWVTKIVKGFNYEEVQQGHVAEKQISGYPESSQKDPVKNPTSKSKRHSVRNVSVLAFFLSTLFIHAGQSGNMNSYVGNKAVSIFPEILWLGGIALTLFLIVNLFHKAWSKFFPMNWNISRLNGSDLFAKNDAARALAATKDERALAALMKTLTNEKTYILPYSYHVLISAVMSFGDKTAIPLLEEALNSPSEKIRRGLVAAVISYGMDSKDKRTAEYLLLKKLEDSNIGIRETTAIGLLMVSKNKSISKKAQAVIDKVKSERETLIKSKMAPIGATTKTILTSAVLFLFLSVLPAIAGEESALINVKGTIITIIQAYPLTSHLVMVVLSLLALRTVYLTLRRIIFPVKHFLIQMDHNDPLTANLARERLLDLGASAVVGLQQYILDNAIGDQDNMQYLMNNGIEGLNELEKYLSETDQEDIKVIKLVRMLKIITPSVLKFYDKVKIRPKTWKTRGTRGILMGLTVFSAFRLYGGDIVRSNSSEAHPMIYFGSVVLLYAVGIASILYYINKNVWSDRIAKKKWLKETEEARAAIAEKFDHGKAYEISLFTKHENIAVRVEAALALGRNGTYGAVGYLGPMIYDDNEYVREQVAHAFSLTNNTNAIAYLNKMMSDGNKDVRIAAKRAVNVLNKKTNVKTTKKASSETDPEKSDPNKGVKINQLFAIVEGVINNPRDKMIDEVDVIIEYLIQMQSEKDLYILRDDISTMALIESINAVLSSLKIFKSKYVGAIPEVILEAEKYINKHLNQLEADNIVNGLIALARDAQSRVKNKSKNIVLAIDLSWIPGYKQDDLVLDNAVDPLAQGLKSLRRNNIKVVIREWKEGKGYESLEDWTGRVQSNLDVEDDYSNSIIFGGVEMVEYFENKILPDIAAKKRPVITGVDSSKLDITKLGTNMYWDINLLSLLSVPFDFLNGRDIEALKMYDEKQSNKILRKIILNLPEMRQKGMREITIKFNNDLKSLRAA
ncbi:MAG: HEAT repeat domain-containing protein [Candidatus Omnitrophica bacterium]|nr:HEAT repeat domain-containing protein [Candidatus Omnitrophota bacterium]